MSTYNDIDITCEKCGEEFRGTVWTAVHAKQDPELRDLLLGGELNMVMCPSCSHVAYQDHFVLYQDPSVELVAYVYPPAQKPEEEALRKMMTKGFLEAQVVYDSKDRKHYDPLLLFGLTDLVEMIRRDEEREEQAEIAWALSGETKIPMFQLRPAKARLLGVPTILPLSSNEEAPTRETILSGISKLLEANPALTVYDELRKRMAADRALFAKGLSL